MISSWMLYAAGSALLLGLAALAAERLLLARARPVRWLWMAAVAGSVLLPAGTLGLALRGGAPAEPTGLVLDTEGIRAIAGVTPAETIGSTRLSIERTLATAWLVGSLGLLAGVLLSLGRIEWWQQRWHSRRVGGRMVLLSEDIGPAVIRFLWPEIVIPRWVLDMDEAAQARVVAHEQEHERAGDPWLLLAGVIALVLLPWNLPLWWQVRRLRLAIEVDCDARVLRELPDARAYGLLLLEVGRRSTGLRLPTAAFAENCSPLERRIRILAGALPMLRRGGLLALGGGAVLASAAAVALPAPEWRGLESLDRALLQGHAAGGGQTAPRSSLSPLSEGIALRLPIRLAASDWGAAAPPGVPLPIATTVQPSPSAAEGKAFDTAPRLRNERDLVGLLERAEPSRLGALRSGGSVLLRIHVDEVGRVVEARIGRTSGSDALDGLARDLFLQAEFVPARRERRSVATWIEVPITFEPRAADAHRSM